MAERKKRILTVLFLGYMAVLLRITVFRSGFGGSALLQNGHLNLTLFLEYIPILREGNWFRFLCLFVGNILWFIPFGAYLKYVRKETKLRVIVLYGFLFSLTIETLQYMFGVGYSELDDLLLNSFGAWIGSAAVAGWRKLLQNDPITDKINKSINF